MVKSISMAEAEARKIVNKWAAGAAAIGWVPGSSLVLAAADIKLVKDLAQVFGVEQYSVEETMASVGASFAGKTIARELLSFVPVIGWAIKSGVAAGVTKATGELFIKYFKDRSPYS